MKNLFLTLTSMGVIKKMVVTLKKMKTSLMLKHRMMMIGRKVVRLEDEACNAE